MRIAYIENLDHTYYHVAEVNGSSIIMHNGTPALLEHSQKVAGTPRYSANQIVKLIKKGDPNNPDVFPIFEVTKVSPVAKWVEIPERYYDGIQSGSVFHKSYLERIMRITL